MPALALAHHLLTEGLRPSIIGFSKASVELLIVGSSLSEIIEVDICFKFFATHAIKDINIAHESLKSPNKLVIWWPRSTFERFYLSRVKRHYYVRNDVRHQSGGGQIIV